MRRQYQLTPGCLAARKELRGLQLRGIGRDTPRARFYGIPTNTELHALNLGTNSNAGRDKLSALKPGDRNRITKAAFSTIRSIAELRVLTVFAPLPGGSGKLYSQLVAFVEEFCAFHDSYAVIWYDGTAENQAQTNRAVHRNLPYSRRVFEDPRGYASSESHLIQMTGFIAHSAHHAVLNDRGISPADSYLRQHAYSKLLPADDFSGHVWPGGIDNHRQAHKRFTTGGLSGSRRGIAQANRSRLVRRPRYLHRVDSPLQR